jgi:hypothetical protein
VALAETAVLVEGAAIPGPQVTPETPEITVLVATVELLVGRVTLEIPGRQVTPELAAAGVVERVAAK